MAICTQIKSILIQEHFYSFSYSENTVFHIVVDVYYVYLQYYTARLI